jgi:hypothetical protein
MAQAMYLQSYEEQLFNDVTKSNEAAMDLSRDIAKYEKAQKRAEKKGDKGKADFMKNLIGVLKGYKEVFEKGVLGSIAKYAKDKADKKVGLNPSMAIELNEAYEGVYSQKQALDYKLKSMCKYGGGAKKLSKALDKMVGKKGSLEGLSMYLANKFADEIRAMNEQLHASYESNAKLLGKVARYFRK